MLNSLVVCLHLCPSEKLIDLEVYTPAYCIHLSTIRLEYSDHDGCMLYLTDKTNGIIPVEFLSFFNEKNFQLYKWAALSF